MGEIRIGTSGWSYREWKGVFYPNSAKPGEYLSLYSRKFSCVEIDSTYYRMPTSRMFDVVSAKAPPGFVFIVKMPAEFTHQRRLSEAAIKRFKNGIYPILRDEKLGGFLAQFPYSFKKSTENLGYVGLLAAGLADYAQMFVEFRHSSWEGDESILEYMKGMNIGYVNVDLPKIPGLPTPTSICTSDKGSYIRFHGRVDSKTWWRPVKSRDRYAYKYKNNELMEWVPRIKELSSRSKSTFVIFNNHFGGYSVENAIVCAALTGIPLKDGISITSLDDYFL
ncbi:MAG: DUF72 domain-containing protein [Nitrososphaerota archaeon]|jgi:uncharacterized protein YecE (DUF72 family)|nr:DUF72 domain-containing protein [Nitrososphaerota archaeon]MDG7040847.1 DUF72 domain-containing protein [Nitrososphaerota archaeon]MDG7047283.1 DUF72 domain-containing protein [Nitrososphaerota archaeon]